MKPLISILISTKIMAIFFILQTAFAKIPKELLIVRGEDEYIPYEIKKANGEYEGIYIEVLKEVLKSQNIKFKIKDYPWGRALEMIKKGKADAITTPFKNKERESFLYFPNAPLAYEETVFFTYKGSSIKYNGDLKSLTKYGIGKINHKIFFYYNNFHQCPIGIINI